VGAGGDDAAQVLDVRVPRLVVGGEGPLDLGDVDLLALPAQGAQQFFLAVVPVVQRPDADPRPLGHRRDGGGGVGQEDLARRLEDRFVVLRCLGLPPAERGRLCFHDAILVIERIVPI